MKGDPYPGYRRPYQGEPYAEHLLPNTAFPIQWAALALALGLGLVAWMAARGWWS